MSASTAPSSLSWLLGSLPFLLYANGREDLQGISCVPCMRHQLADAPRGCFHGNPPPFPLHCPLAGSPSVQPTVCTLGPQPLTPSVHSSVSLTPFPLYKQLKEASLTASSISLSLPPPQVTLPSDKRKAGTTSSPSRVLCDPSWCFDTGLVDRCVDFKRFWWVSLLYLLGSINPLFGGRVHICKCLFMYLCYIFATD